MGRPADAVELLERMALIEPGEKVRLEALDGGVSSDIWLVTRGGERFILKRARAQLKVAAEWHAPVSRGASEAAWLAFAAQAVPGSSPRVLAVDPESFAMALEYFDAAVFRNWKSELLAGRISAEAAGAVGRTLGRIQAESTRVPGLAECFANDELFESLRIEPYLRRTAEARPDVRHAIEDVISALESTRLGLVHGDVSPKNILVGAGEVSSPPVILDAECATWGEPAFDAAFCLAHLVLKEIHLPASAIAFRGASRAFESAYLREASWAEPAMVRERILRILPALVLARVVGASPVDYLDESEQARVEGIAMSALRTGRTIWDILDEEGEAG